MYQEAKIEDLIGKRIIAAQNGVDEGYGENILLKLITDAGEYAFTHYQSCCESVVLESVDGELDGILGEVVKFAESSSNGKETGTGDEEWTFYKIGTQSDTLTFRFYGESNGWYGTEVNFVKLELKKEDE